MSQIISHQTKRALLNSIYDPIRVELAATEQVMLAELDRDIPWMDELLSHTNLAGGKRMRPALVLLTGGACDHIHKGHYCLAAALEMIHTASLIHDDVIDDAEHRRHCETVNAKWNSKTSVLLGDYLFTHAFYVASNTESIPVLRRLSEASNHVCEGEMKQNAWAGQFEISENDYIEMITEKTAELCSCACYGGALLSGADIGLARRFEGFGTNIGIAFQIVDDVLDLVGQADRVGKTLGTDLKNQKPTLPVIRALQQSATVSRQKLMELLTGSEPNRFEVLELLEQTGSIEYAQQSARCYAQRALAFVRGLPDSPARDSLNRMAEFILDRTY